MLSGLVPLGVDILRYLKTFIDKPTEEELFWSYELFQDRHEAKQMKCRSELAQQAIGFGARVHTR